MTVKTLKNSLPGIGETSRLELPGKYLVLFGGKGGCGKTTCSAATGIYMAEHGKKTLVLSTDPQHSLTDSFDQEIALSDSFRQETTEQATSIEGVNNLYAMEIDAERLLKEWREENKETLIQIASDATILDTEDISSFLDLSLPGMDELMAQRKLQNLIKKREFDLYILDTAPTGHTLRFLELPNMMSDWVKLLMKMRSKARYIAKAFFGTRAQRIKARADIFLVEEMDNVKKIKVVFKSPHTEFIPVTTLEEMAVNESERLLETLKHNGIHVNRIICNRIAPLNPKCGYCMSMRNMQQEELHRVRDIFSHYRIVDMPWFPHEIRGVSDLSSFAKVLFEGVD